MIERGVNPDMESFDTVCKALAMDGRSASITAVMACMEGAGYELNENHFAFLLRSCGASRPPDTAGVEIALRDMACRGFRRHHVKGALKRAFGRSVAALLLHRYKGDLGIRCASFQHFSGISHSTHATRMVVLGRRSIQCQR